MIPKHEFFDARTGASTKSEEFALPGTYTKDILHNFYSQTALEKLQQQNDDLERAVGSMRTRMKAMQHQQDELMTMMRAVVRKIDAVVDDDSERGELYWEDKLPQETADRNQCNRMLPGRVGSQSPGG